MSAERAIHEHWSGYQPLTALVPAERIYTGLPPLRDAEGQRVTLPYVALSARGPAVVTRTSSGTVLTTETIRFSVYSQSYDEARRIARLLGDYFNRRDFAWSRGGVLDMKPLDRLEQEDPEDGVWLVARDFQVQTVDTA